MTRDESGSANSAGERDGRSPVEEGNRSQAAVAHGTADAEQVKVALGRLAGPGAGSVIRRADRATDDVEQAADFLDAVGLERLVAAIDAVEDPELRNRGERALDSFRRFGRVASTGRPESALGQGDSASPDDAVTRCGDETTGAAADRRPADHFRGARGTDLRCGDESPPR